MRTDIDVTAALRLAILQGDFVGGQRLVEADLCEQFNVTRFVARTALRELAAEGLVELRRNQGARVRVVTLAEAVEITEVRRALESPLAARAAELSSPSEKAELLRIAHEMREAASGGELLRYSDLNAELHLAIRQIGRHRTASRIIDQLHGQMVRYQFRLGLQPGRPQVSLPQHEAIVFAIVAGNPEAAEEAMRDHIGGVLAAYRELLDDAAHA